MAKLKLKFTPKALIIESPEEERWIEVTKKFDRSFYDQLVEHFELSYIKKNLVYFNGNIQENGKLIIQDEIK